MTTNTLPENDPDLQLARRIGKYLEGELEQNDIIDPFLRGLFEYREARLGKTAEDSGAEGDAVEMWRAISDATERRENPGKIHPLNTTGTDSKTIWAVAASLLIAAFIGFGIYFYANQQTQVIATSAESIQTITLKDGSTVTLRPYSTIQALNVSAKSQSYKLEGEAYFEVSSDSDRTFSVIAGNGKVSVLGTKFDLSNWGNQTQVYLEEGSVKFENLETDDSITLSPGEAAEIGADNRLKLKPAEINEFTDWMNSQLTFRNKSALYVFHEMEQEFNITITAPDSVLNTKLSGSLALSSVNESLEDLSLVLDGKFVKEEEKSYKFVPNR